MRRTIDGPAGTLQLEQRAPDRRTDGRMKRRRGINQGRRGEKKKKKKEDCQEREGRRRTAVDTGMERVDRGRKKRRVSTNRQKCKFFRRDAMQDFNNGPASVQNVPSSGDARRP